MSIELTPADLREDLPPEKVGMSDDALVRRITEAKALAAMYAPCIERPKFKQSAAARAIVRGAILYDIRAEVAGPNATEQAGPFQRTQFAPSRSGTLFSPSQIEALRALCPAPAMRQSYSVPLGMPNALIWPRERGDVWVGP